MFLKLLLVFIVSTLVSCELETEETYSIELSPNTFNDAIKKNNHFVMFFAPWCSYCKKLHPVWEQLAELMNVKDEPLVLISKVDCTAHQSLCAEHDITGYPTLKFFKLDSNESVKFKGTRDLPTLTDFIQEQIGNKDLNESVKIPLPTSKLVELTEDTFAKHIAKGRHFVKFYAPWCSHCQRLAPTWDELAKSLEYDESVKISKIDCTLNRPICQDFEVKGYPTLLWIEDGKKVEKYSGARNIDNLKEYVEKQVQGGDSSSQTTEEQKEEEIKVEDSSTVVQLTGNSFEHGVENGVSFVKFYAPWCGHCQKLSPVWEQLAVKMLSKSGVKIAKVDCTLPQNKELCSDQQVEGYPTLFIYKNGEKLEEYNGSRQLDDLYSFAIKFIEHDEL